MKFFPNIQGPKRTVLQTGGVVVLMASLSWASVPFYDWFCRVTGFGGATNVVYAESDVVLDQTIKIRFDASLAKDMPWEFKPEVREMEIRIGETGLAFYEAHNPLDVPIADILRDRPARRDGAGHFDNNGARRHRDELRIALRDDCNGARKKPRLSHPKPLNLATGRFCGCIPYAAWQRYWHAV